MKGGVAARFTATLEPDFATACETWERLAEEGGVLAFQSRAWLAAWAATLGRRSNLDLLPITLHDEHGLPVAGLPLVREVRGMRRIGFADGGLADYNAPILGRTAPVDRDGALDLWKALRRVLPEADAVRFERMPISVGRRPNPLALLPGVARSSSLGLSVELEHGYEGWLADRPRRYRMELGRCSRLFDALPGAAFRRVAPEDASEVLDALEGFQRARVASLALPYALDDPHVQAFHRMLAARSEAGILFALFAGDRVVAALFGVRFGSCFVMLRVAADPAHARLSPARLVIARAIERLVDEGVRSIDLGLGDYDYKRRLGGQPVELVDFIAARSLRGSVELADHRLRAMLRAYPRARATVHRVRGIVGVPRFRPTPSP